ncbi:MAG: methyltransferase domain-containing protein [Spirochaetes bacterium]|nr:methyltransferase domain-containing protein [Spirochaetota bacterium]NLJ04583.1 methyltransferase domain-containing protein [Exilispira sp.]MBP8991029.1 methyltransferase domain-containing protein [Spirochaetota bacterium]HOV45406.1 methyltransferase domain-containing protein [Exilispira sp.]HQM88877.1 methyltransferase domain-containing protein [Exilispira sp.]
MILNDEFILLFYSEDTKFLIKYESGSSFNCHKGGITFPENLNFGDCLVTNKGYKFYVLKPKLKDRAMRVKRSHTIVYPKEAPRIIYELGILPGMKVAEIGTGSGAMTLILAETIGEKGEVVTIDISKISHENAKDNIIKYGVSNPIERIKFILLADEEETPFDKRMNILKKRKELRLQNDLSGKIIGNPLNKAEKIDENNKSDMINKNLERNYGQFGNDNSNIVDNLQEHSNVGKASVDGIDYTMRVEKTESEQQEDFNRKLFEMAPYENEFDAVFVDIPQPWTVIPFVKKILKKGYRAGFLSPTVEQVAKSFDSLSLNNFINLECFEIMERKWKIKSGQCRPVDRMIAHTAFIYFASSLTN